MQFPHRVQPCGGVLEGLPSPKDLIKGALQIEQKQKSEYCWCSGLYAVTINGHEFG